MSRSSSLYRRHRFSGEIISHCVWLYYRFSLSYRDIEEMMAQRGVRVSYETIRQWCLKFGQTIADELRRRRPRPGEKWHLDEVHKSAEQAQRFLAPFGLIGGHFRLGRHRLKAEHYRQEMGSRFRTWREVSGLVARAGGPRLRVTISPAKPR